MNKRWMMASLVVVVIATTGLLLTINNSNNVTGNIIDSNVFTVPLSDITTTANFYEYENIRFFIVKASDGTIKAAFDACDVCYGSKKGYRQEGDYMICNNCGNKYPITGLGTENKNPGGCWPGYLPSIIEGNNLVIKVSDIKSGSWRF